MITSNAISDHDCELFLHFIFSVEQQKAPGPLSPPVSSNSPLIGSPAALLSNKEIKSLIKQGQWIQVFSFLDPLCDATTAEVDYLAFRAAAYIKTNNLIGALQDTEKALKIKPNELRLLKTHELLWQCLFGSSVSQPIKK